MLLFCCNCKGLPSLTDTLFCGAYLYLCNCSLEQELRICTVPTVHRWSRSIDLLFLHHEARIELSAKLPGRFNTGKYPILILQEAVCALERFGQVRKISTSMGFEHLTVQLVAQSLYRLS